MDKTALTFLFFLFLLSKYISGDTNDDCRPTLCSPTGPQVRFPFRIRDRQPSACGFPGFDLSCNEQNKTILHLTSSRSYTVNKISYGAQIIYIDPEFCRSNSIGDFNITGTPFDFRSMQSYRFYNCSWIQSSYKFHMMSLPCLNSVNHSVIALRNGQIPEGKTAANCQDIGMISVPIRRYGGTMEELELMWFTPYCRSCEIEGRMCGLKGSYGETTCLAYNVVVWYIAKRAREYNESMHQNVDTFSITVSQRPNSSPGLDTSTIESYKTTILGESRRLPKDDYDTCPICLTRYEPRDALRTIPECKLVYALESDKKITVAAKMNHNVLEFSLRRAPRDGVEIEQFRDMIMILECVELPAMYDIWIWSLVGSGEFSVASARKFIDDHRLAGSPHKTRWVKAVPIKINVMAWKVRFDFLPTRLNLSRKGLELQSILCPICNKEVESTSHIFFACSMVRDLYRKIASWWELSYSKFDSYDDWLEWFQALRMHSKHRDMLEGGFYATW
ncbi:putative RING-H2 finger protein ATL21A [Tanacetum coccineum]